MSQLPALAPRPPGETPSLTDRQNSKEHTEREWEAHREIIERLYIDENRKLADTMTIMVSKHGFAATEQMYKKRLKKWNVRKRAYRKVPDSPVASTPAPVSDHTSASPMEVDLQHQTPNYGSQPVCTTIARTTRFGSYAGLELILDTVRSWSLCKLESSDAAPDPMVRYLANPNQPPIQDSRTMYRTFELVFDLWCHGKGQLAGMAARKAFYILEFVLTEDHPDLIWHMLDTIYDMVDRGHIQLLGMFLAHASQLSRRCLPREHPLVKILEQLIKCDYQSQEGREQVCYLLRTAWLRNVDILSDHIGSLASKHLWLYEQLIWDGRTRLRKECELARIQGTMMTALTDLHRHTDADSPVGKLDRLRIMALMLEYTQMDIGDRQKAEKLAIDLLNHTSEGEQGSRSNARFHAYARKMLARLQEHRQDWAQAEENLRYAVEKRETAHGTGTDLRVIRDIAALKTHPDRVPSDSPERTARTRKFQLVNDAYYTLSDATRRRDYDAQRRLFTPSTPAADPFEEADEEIPPQPNTTGQNAYSWAWNFFNSHATGDANNAERERTENAQFSDVFEEMMREEGMAEEGSNSPTGKFWSLVGGLSGGALGFIVANFPGMLAGAVAGNRLGAVRDAKGKSVYEVYSALPQDDRARLLSQLATRVFSHVAGV
ncbi:DNAJ domain-containing protein [Pochonia chlamydosporia 170]|uniref:DNAJ domain-containing protein n=1 Tax=Pochonia chlamydosporia 170 TaxID=1380566 RepID=A0A179G5H9_METCM|nr:DNAJ domain-containing protein [Pochonia chlamydosporia 170]OAQ72738.2 DNAJ domain-containing protein [Pochonia chlamydosporia 170]